MPARISRTSPFSGLVHTMEFDLYEQDDFELRLFAWRRGDKLIQDAFPELTDGAREFIKSGITPLEWAKYMGEEDE